MSRFDHCSNSLATDVQQVAAACPDNRCATRLQAKLSMLDVLGFAIGALYTWSAYMVGKTTARTQNEESGRKQYLTDNPIIVSTLPLDGSRHARLRDANSLIARLQAKKVDDCNCKLTTADGSRYTPLMP